MHVISVGFRINAGAVADHAGAQQALEARDSKFILSDPSKSRMESWQHEGGLSAEMRDWGLSTVFRVELQLSDMGCMVSARQNHSPGQG